MATFGEIQDRVKFNLNRYDISAVMAEVPYWINAECRRWHERALWPPGEGKPGIPHNWTWLTASQSFSTTASTTLIGNLPTDFRRAIRIGIALDSSTPIRVRVGDYAQLYQRYYGATAVQPARGVSRWALGPGGATLYLFPPPDAIYSGWLDYLSSYTDLANTGDSNQFTIRFWDGIVAGATGRGHLALGRGEGMQEAQPSLALAQSALLEAIAMDRQAQTEEDIDLEFFADNQADGDNPRPQMDASDVPPLEEGW